MVFKGVFEVVVVIVKLDMNNSVVQLVEHTELILEANRLRDFGKDVNTFFS